MIALKRWAAAALAAAILNGCGEEVMDPAQVLGFKQLETARRAMMSHNYEVALKHYRQAFARRASIQESRTGIVRALIAMGRLEEADALSDRVVKGFGDRPEPYELAIQLKMLLDRLDDAHLYLLRLEELRPKGKMTLLLSAELYLVTGLLTRAEQAIVEGESLYGELPDWAFLRARLDFLRQYVEAGERGYTAAVERFPEPESWIKLAYFEHLLGRSHQAEQVLLKAQERAQGQPEPYSLLADFYASMGRYSEAMAELGALRQTLSRPNPDLARRAASLLLRTGEQAEAQGFLRPVLTAQSNDGLVARELSMSYLLDGQPEKARSVLLDLVRERPDAAHTQYLLGLTELHSPRPQSARKSFSAMLISDPDNLLARYGLALAGLRSESWYDASFEASKILEVQPQDLVAGLIWGVALLGEQKRTEALIVKRWLLKSYPDRAAEIESMIRVPEGVEIDPDRLPRLPEYVIKAALSMQPQQP